MLNRILTLSLKEFLATVFKDTPPAFIYALKKNQGSMALKLLPLTNVEDLNKSYTFFPNGFEQPSINITPLLYILEYLYTDASSPYMPWPLPSTKESSIFANLKPLIK